MAMERAVKPQRPVTEYNVSRLGLISIQSRVADDQLMGWEAIQTDGSNRQGIICTTSDPFGVPRGLASDVFSGLLTAATIRAEGGGSGQELTMTAAGIAKHANLKLHDRHYRGIDQALSALASAKYKVFAQWTDPMTRTSRDATFSVIDFLERQQEEHLFNRTQAQMNYVVRLNREIVRSVEGSLVLAISPTILESLPNPGARAVYRMLESMRRDPEDVTRAHKTLKLSIGDLAEATRLLGSRQEASHQMRILAPYLNALIAGGYLSSYQTIGRSARTQVHFVFVDDGSLVNMESRRLLLKAGVTGKNAESLAIGHSREEIECAIWLIDDKKGRDSTIRNPAGLIVKTLKDGTARDMLGTFRQRSRPVAVKAERQKALPNAQAAAPASGVEVGRGILQGLVNRGKMTAEEMQLLVALHEQERLSLQEITSLVGATSAAIQKLLAERKA